VPKINQIVILNGGYGSRVRSISGNLPKCLIKIGGIPFLFHQLDLIKKAKIRNVVLCLGYKSQYVINFLKKNYYLFVDYNVKRTFNARSKYKGVDQC
jgi:D-glycero-alpha-D-manno-heptose 1-phosphate guanylyltransferase